jgi:hypothetical protein
MRTVPDLRDAHRWSRLILVAVLATTFTWRGAASSVVDRDATLAMHNFLERQATPHEYHAQRHLEASGSGQRGWLDVQTQFTVAAGLRYEVTAEGGSGYIRSRVLRSMLDEEQETLARGATPTIAISAANYRFAPESLNEERLAVVGMQPLRKARNLIAGQMFLTIDGDLLRIQGRLVKNPSFWVTRVELVKSYGRINGVLMPVSLETTAQLRLLGSSALRMTYRYSQIDEHPVVETVEDVTSDLGDSR